MRRSKYGYLLLALLVITGLAGTITSTTISSKERKFAANNFKDTKNDLLNCVKGLSESQINFKPAPDKRSIRQCVDQIAVSEKNLWTLLQATLKDPANPEKRSEIKLTDDQLIRMVEDRDVKTKGQFYLESGKAGYKTLDEALESFRSSRANHIKYIKNTTEDLRNHVIQTSLGWLDCYQLCLLISAQSDRLMRQIEEIKANTNFPRR